LLDEISRPTVGETETASICMSKLAVRGLDEGGEKTELKVAAPKILLETVSERSFWLSAMFVRVVELV
jgi:hypothetical protein